MATRLWCFERAPNRTSLPSRWTINLNTVIGAYLSVLYALSLVCFTLYPLPSGESGLGITYGIAPQLNPFGFLNDLAKDGIGAIPQIFANIAFFVPLGFIAGRLLRAPLFHSLFFRTCYFPPY